MAETGHVVIFGGAGFIGSQLTNILLERGYRVTVVSRSASTRKSTNSMLAYRSASVTQHDLIHEAIAGADFVFDLTMPFGGGPDWESFSHEVVGGAKAIAQSCIAHSVRRLIYTSSISALYLGGSGRVSEENGPDPFPEKRSLYGRGKIEAERALLALHASQKLPVVIMRPGVVVGPGSRLLHGALGDVVSDIHVFGYGKGAYPLPFVLVQDVAQALFNSMITPGIEGLSFNLAGDVRPTASQYVEYIARHSARNFQFHPRAVWRIQFREILLYVAKRIIRGSAAECASLRDPASLAMSAPIDCSRAKKLLGWQPVSDPDEFYKQAVLANLQPVKPGDLRLTS
jgi:nucleoside-diphosphate-sugar epimerase